MKRPEGGKKRVELQREMKKLKWPEGRKNKIRL